ncbi:DNA polymerase II large subunit [Methanococcoides methylutens]|uniref:DNA polymerase II large subunit n=1 Tax=Methanococcoides methylutens TaxID=2226 RepID=A0A099T5N0_METMT|nr:DNA polymerase II large subunit [Methanococcoides methylutens]KGK99501.1 DNA polymerase II large subunit [Methanococcoides methylutens]
MAEIVASKEMHEYFNTLEGTLKKEIEIVNNARSKGKDPKPHVEIPLAKDLADRVENLIGVKGVAELIRKLEETRSREEAALALGREVAQGKVGTFDSKSEAIEAAIRVSVAMLTEGVVAAPIEGIDRAGIGKNDDGSEYVSIFYAGPIRSAGGTAQALSVLVGDYVRRGVGIDRYKPRKEEVERYIEEIMLYKRVASLQYTPSEEEIRLIVENCPICIDGEPTEAEEVEGHRNLERIDTNRVRGGMALVLAEGLALKAPKIQKHVKKLKIDGWEWLEQLISGTKSASDDSGEEKKDEKPKIKPKDKYMRDLIAGRPVFSHPSRPGGFRLRYGRSRNTSFAAAGINPSGMLVMDDFIAPGTQLKVERPGKAAGMAPVDSIEGPTVKLRSGDVVRIDRIDEAYELRSEVEEIIDIGEILINYGDFLENNHPLAPSPYCFEWWIQEYRKAGGEQTDGEEVLKDPSQDVALDSSKKYGVALHPKFTYLWHDIENDKFEQLADFISENGILESERTVLKLPHDAALSSGVKRTLELLLVLHRISDGMILIKEPLPFIYTLGLDDGLRKKWESLEHEEVLDNINQITEFEVRPRAPTRIGARMGRPEKSDKRKMSPAPHVLFPIAESGGNTRKLENAASFKASTNAKVGEIAVEIGNRICPACGVETFEYRCDCGEYTMPKLFCPRCGISVNKAECPKCGTKTTCTSMRKIDFKSIYQKAFEKVGERDKLDSFKGVKKMMSKDMTPEPLEKGILRAKHDLFTFKDGTVRYDMSDIPLTHIRPSEIGVTCEKLKELGYKEDIYGKPLTDPEQVLCLKVQDLVISYDCADYILRTMQYIDDLLVKYYKEDPYYNAKTRDDTVGTLLMGLAPHTSAGVLGRLVGFTTAAVGYAHPFFHAAKRRNCDGDEDCVMLLMDGLLNFSREYLPDKRGGKMDAPLVLTTRLDPSEVDKEAHNIDVCESYPLEFYEATLRIANPKEFEDTFDLVSSRLGTPLQYEKFMFTHDTSNIAAGPLKSAYKTLGSMVEKMDAQLELGKKIRAVDASDVAERVLISHFLPDMFGNLRAFSRQGTRCVKCGAKYRRPPLTGSCQKCGGRVILTVHEGAVKKYLEVSMKVAEEYNVSSYTKQRIELIGYDMKSLFENDRSKQMGLSDFM